MKKTIYFVRHGETDYNKQGIVQGNSIDSSLNDLGKSQAKIFYEKYKNIGFEVVLVSSLKRTKETMSPFIEEGIPVESYSEIDEVSWGELEGLKKSPENSARFKQVSDTWAAGDYDARIEKGESLRELNERVTRFWEMLKQRPEQKIIVCTHGRTIALMCTKLKKYSLGRTGEFLHRNVAVTKATFDGENFEVETYGDLSHFTKD